MNNHVAGIVVKLSVKFSAAVILLLDLVRVLSGKASEEDLISVKEGE